MQRVNHWEQKVLGVLKIEDMYVSLMHGQKGYGTAYNRCKDSCLSGDQKDSKYIIRIVKLT